MTTIEYGPILSHVVYGDGDGTSPDGLCHYTELGELLVPQGLLDECHRAARAAIDSDPDNAIARFISPQSDEPAWVAAYNATFTWDELLLGDGWQLHHTDRDGTCHWVRPGKSARDGSSATTGHSGIDKLHVFSSSIDWLPSDDSYSRWAYMVHRDFGGDFRAASRAIRKAAR